MRKNGIKFSLTREVESFEIDNKDFTKSEETFSVTEISNLLLLGCIDIAPLKPTCISPISCVPNKSGKFRLVTDLRRLNTHIFPQKVNYKDINKPKDYMSTADLQNGFFHILVHIQHQTLLGFKFKSTYYTWSVLPFGHNRSPFYFTKILRPVVTFLRILGIRIVLYIDDFILFATKDAIQSHKSVLLSTQEQLG